MMMLKKNEKLCLTEQNHVQIHLVAKAKFVQWFLKTDVQKPGFWVSYDFWDLSQKQKKSLDAQKPRICTVVFKNRCTESAILQSSDFTWFPTINHVKLYMGKKNRSIQLLFCLSFEASKSKTMYWKPYFLGGEGGRTTKPCTGTPPQKYGNPKPCIDLCKFEEHDKPCTHIFFWDSLQKMNQDDPSQQRKKL